MTTLLPCPICGKEPALSDEDAFLHIDCCVSMTRQKSDYLSFDEIARICPETFRYSYDAEKKAVAGIASEWNQREFKASDCRHVAHNWKLYWFKCNWLYLVVLFGCAAALILKGLSV